MARASSAVRACALLGVMLGVLGLRMVEVEPAAWPSVIVAGIGDSGTTAVIRSLEILGLMKCSEKRDFFVDEPSWGHDDRSRFVRAFLEAGNRSMTREAYRHDPVVWQEAVSYHKALARRERRCVEKSHGDLGHRKFGYKEPHYAWVLPVFDEAFENRSHYLLVARDPRDICSNDIQDQFRLYGWQMGIEDCYEWWARFWDELLNRYENSSHFRVVRIEDLVMPEPTWDGASMAALRCAVNHTGMVPDWSATAKALVEVRMIGGESLLQTSLMRDPQHVKQEEALESLKTFHDHTSAYMGHHDGFDEAKRQQLVEAVVKRRGDPRLHRTMRRLGYSPDRFELLRAISPSVCGR